MNTRPERKAVLVWFSRDPYASRHAQEGLDALLALAAFDQPVTAYFDRDAVTLLLPGQGPEAIDRKHFSRGFAALPLYGEVTCVYDPDDADRLGVDPAEFAFAARPLARTDTAAFLRSFDTILTF